MKIVCVCLTVIFFCTAAVAADHSGSYGDTSRGYSRYVREFRVPDVTLVNQDGRNVRLRDVIDSDKPVIFDFVYTTCTTICPVLSASFANLNRELGADADKVQLVSISIDPENDHPDRMKKYLSRFRAGKNWQFLTGNRESITKVLKAMDAYTESKMDHKPFYLIHVPKSDVWVNIRGLVKKGDLLFELRRINNI